MDRPIYYYTGPVQTGKTTKITEWSKENNCGGILAPIINGKRHLKVLSTGEQKLLEVESGSGTISIGRYHFNKDVFEWGRIELLKEYETKPEWLIIDEFGKLELRGVGLEPAISKVLDQWKIEKNVNLLIIVRDYLVKDLIKKYDSLDVNFKEFIT